MKIDYFQNIEIKNYKTLKYKLFISHDMLIHKQFFLR
jgi:hypothetical protein